MGAIGGACAGQGTVSVTRAAGMQVYPPRASIHGKIEANSALHVVLPAAILRIPFVYQSA
jgi:hypothetical protein